MQLEEGWGHTVTKTEGLILAYIKNATSGPAES